MQVRLVITTKSGNTHYGKSVDLDDAELERTYEFCEGVGEMSYVKLTRWRATPFTSEGIHWKVL